MREDEDEKLREKKQKAMWIKVLRMEVKQVEELKDNYDKTSFRVSRPGGINRLQWEFHTNKNHT